MIKFINIFFKNDSSAKKSSYIAESVTAFGLLLMLLLDAIYKMYADGTIFSSSLIICWAGLIVYFLSSYLFDRKKT